jgi:hypothetical protein
LGCSGSFGRRSPTRSIKRIDKKIVDRLTPILRKAIQSAILDHVARSFSHQHPEPAAAPPPAAPPPAAAPAVALLPAASGDAATTGAVITAAPEVRDRVSTTPEELDVYSQVAKIVRESHPDAQVLYRDAKTYFTIMQKNLRKWFIRLGIEKQPFWIAFRHVKVDAARSLCPGVDVTDGGGLGDSKIAIKSTGDIAKLKPIILASYEAEAARIADVSEMIADIEPSQ